MFNNGVPESVEGTMARFENDFGVTRSPFRNCRPRGNGWMVILNTASEYSMAFEGHEHITNISFKGDIDNFEKDEWVTIRHDFAEKVSYTHFKTKAGEEHGNRITGAWPNNPLSLNSFDYHVREWGNPYSLRYTVNGKAAEKNPEISEDGEALTGGQSFFIHPLFFKCFGAECEDPDPTPPPSPFPEQTDCMFLDCFEGTMPPKNSDIIVLPSQRMIIDSAAVTAANGHMHFGGVVVDGTMQIAADAIAPGGTLIIEAEYMLVNTNKRDEIETRTRRETYHATNGAIIIGTATEPIPCDRKVIIRINGNLNSTSFGALPGSIPFGQKFIGGIGGVQIHGCHPGITWTTLTTTINAGDGVITVDDDTSWNVGDEIAIASSDFEQRHTEYFEITAIDGTQITLNATASWRHLGSSSTGI